ncbi:MAG TPA: FG-GAP-like repeat-containing protein [Phycisphaerales bacterium]|nr:FG-GAP-like repeat-containing protein [Phycisphaerales bacterium]
MPRTIVRAPLAALALALAHGVAGATWSIVLIDTRTGEVALGSATCLTNFDLQAGTPVLIPRLGGATAQSFVDQGGFNRTFIRDRLLEGVPTDEIIALLAGFDPTHHTRQYGLADVHGNATTFTGSGAGSWAGGQTGRVGDVVYAVQGNVLAGEPVVSQCVVAIESALLNGADLAEAMMIGMQEARIWGGDGRCNCGTPADGCGSPPDGWDPETGKSAHIAYMLIARDGDGFGCNGMYRASSQPRTVSLGDMDGDGRTDVVVANSQQGRVSVHFNISNGTQYAMFDPQPHVYNVGGGARAAAVARINNDPHPDIITADASLGRVSVLLNLGNGFFIPGTPVTVGGSPQDIIAADLDGTNGDDAALVSSTDSSVKILLNTGGSLGPATSITVGGLPTSIVAADFNLDGHPDLAVADETGDRVVVLINNGAGAFTIAHDIPVGDRPFAIAAGDLDNDGRPDIATANFNDGTATILFNRPGGFDRTDLANPTRPTAVAMADLDGDGVNDLIVTDSQTSSFTVYLGVEGAPPVKERTYLEVRSPNRIAVHDFNQDGRLDLAVNSASANGITVVNGADPRHATGLFANGAGCATSDYHMEFNVAFQSAQSPDPVAQLQDTYDAWRTGLLGRPDAVRSAASLSTDRLPLGSTASMTIDVRDWMDAPVDPGLAVVVEHAPDSAGIATASAATDNGNGTYTVHLATGDAPPGSRGVDRYLVLLDDGQGTRPVIVMPRPELRIVPTIADWNGDGVVDTRDLLDFLSDYAAKDPEADLNGDTTVDSRDAFIFLNAWAGN